LTATLNDIAKVVGVRISTVSRVLNDKPNPIKISEVTRRKIQAAAEELGYHPSAAARALATKRTGHIGFILSDTIAGGWLNVYYARYLVGVEQATRRRGYGMNISIYNLSNVDTFVFPTKVGQRSVDGLVLSGYVEEAIVHRFREFGVPCISLGQDTESAGLIPTIANDDVAGTTQAIQYAAKLGHRTIFFQHSKTRRGREKANLIIQQIRNDPDAKDCRIVLTEPAEYMDYTAGKPLVEAWLAIPKEQRPTVIMASDQTLVMVLRELEARGLKCPRDVSLICGCDTLLCQLSNPQLTGIDYNSEELAETAVDMLMDHLDLGKPLTPEMSRNDYPCKLVVRESCVPLK
jgi:DNA-binding LacI/PurR family transcriptional regulator